MDTKIQDVVQVLSDVDAPLTAKVIYSLSDMSDADRQSLAVHWGIIPIERRRLLIQRLTEASETNFEMDFGAVTRVALTDLDDQLREAAIEATWADESPDMVNRLLPLASVDPSIRVRAAAVSALGRFILLSELGKFDYNLARQAENLALRLYNNLREPVEVRRRALEAISNCSRPEVLDMIKAAYKDKNEEMRISAVYAMGRSCDAQWAPIVLKELRSDISEMRYEAARAAGELELTAAVPRLAPMLDDDDREIMEMAIWALGEIGSGEAQRLLKEMADRTNDWDDEGLSDALDEALAASSLSGADFSFN